MHLFYFYYFLGGYLIGSIPFAFLLTKRKHGIDIRNAGSGNVGARNVYEVTLDKRTGVIVLLLDLLKGLVPVLLMEILHSNIDALPWLAFGIVLGHCYPIWLGWHGGRGLATTAGIMLLISPVAILLWLLAYFLSSKIRPQVHLNSMIALLVVAVALVSVPDAWLARSSPSSLDPPIIREGVLFLLVVLFSRHIVPVWQYARTINPTK